LLLRSCRHSLQRAALIVIASFFRFVRGPPRPTLFPYTTLFRSLRIRRRHHRAPGMKSLMSTKPLESVETPLLALIVAQGSTTAIDRKSTRLNSSHEWISYAVFCLKKKNRTTREPRRAGARAHCL